MIINNTNIDYLKDDRLESEKYDNFNSWFLSNRSNNNSPGRPLSLDVMHLNIRSLKKHFDSLQMELGLNLGLNMFDVIILSEIFCNEADVNLYHLDMFDYKRAYKLRSSKEGGGLMVFYNSQKLHYTPVDLQTNTYESITMKLELKNVKDAVTFYLHAVYRPPTSSTGVPINNSLQEIEWALNQLKHCSNLIFIGDTNIDIMKCRDNELGDREIHNTLQYEAVLSTLGLLRGIYDYTREEIRNGKLTQTCIDHIYSRSNADLIYTGVVTMKLSDHYPVTIRLEWKKYEEINKTKCIYRYNEKQIQSNLKEINWNEILIEANNVNDNFDLLAKKFEVVRG